MTCSPRDDEKHGQRIAGAGVQRRNVFRALERMQEGVTVVQFTLAPQYAMVGGMKVDRPQPGTRAGSGRREGCGQPGVEEWRVGQGPIPCVTVQDGPARARVMDAGGITAR